MKNKAFTIGKINLVKNKIPYLVTGIIIIAVLVQNIIYLIRAPIADKIGDIEISIGNYFWILILMAAILIPTQNFSKIINLGGKRDNFFLGCLISYGILTVSVSLCNTIIYYTYDRFFNSVGYLGTMINCIEVFGWNKHGAGIVFVRQFAFLFLLATFFHTLTAVQGKWYGWITNLVIVTIISVFTPIASLRATLAWFFRMIIFHPNPLLHITFSLVLAITVYLLNKPIFARKII